MQASKGNVCNYWRQTRENLCKEIRICAICVCCDMIDWQDKIIESFRFEDEDEPLCFHHNEIFELFRLQLGRDDEVDCNNIVTDLSMRTMSKSWTWSSCSSSNLKLSND